MNVNLKEVQMARFVIENKVYDTSKMRLMGKVQEWYEYQGLLRNFYGKGYGRYYDCDLYRSNKGNWLLVRWMNNRNIGECVGETISEKRAKQLLMKYDYDAYVKEYGELEEA